MKISNITIQLIIISLSLSLVKAQSEISYQNSADEIQPAVQFKQTILNPNRIQMNSSFSLSTSISGTMNQTTGIYYNFSSYKLSEKMNIETNIIFNI